LLIFYPGYHQSEINKDIWGEGKYNFLSQPLSDWFIQSNWISNYNKTKQRKP